MDNKQIRVRIFADGQIQAEVLGVKGPACTDYIEILEHLLGAETIDSAYTPEYYELEQADIQQQQINSNKRM